MPAAHTERSVEQPPPLWSDGGRIGRLGSAGRLVRPAVPGPERPTAELPDQGERGGRTDGTRAGSVTPGVVATAVTFNHRFATSS